MSVRIEWFDAKNTCAEIFAPGDDWVGAGFQGTTTYALTLSHNEIAAIEGTPEELHALADRIRAVVPMATPKPGSPEAPPVIDHDTYADDSDAYADDYAAAAYDDYWPDGPDGDYGPSKRL